MLLSIVMAAALLVEPAAPPPADPREVAQEVAVLVEAGDLEAALGLIEAANLAHPNPIFMFMRASLEEQLGRCDAAVALYREFSRAPDVDAQDREAAAAGLRRCGVEPPPPGPPPPVVVPPPEVLSPPPPAPAPSEPLPKRPYAWGIGMTSAGVVMAAAGAGLWGRALVDTRAARTSETREAFLTLSERAERFEPTGIALVSIGAVLTVSGIVQLIVQARRARAIDRPER